MRLNRHSLFFPAVTLTVLTITLTVILAISTYRNLHRERTQMEESITREGVALLRLFETVLQSRDYGDSERVAEVQQLVSAAAPNENIAYIYYVQSTGTDSWRIAIPKWLGNLLTATFHRVPRFRYCGNMIPQNISLKFGVVFTPFHLNSLPPTISESALRWVRLSERIMKTVGTP